MVVSVATGHQTLSGMILMMLVPRRNEASDGAGRNSRMQVTKLKDTLKL